MQLRQTNLAAFAVGAFGSAAGAEDRGVTYKSANRGSSYYQMGVGLPEAMKAGSRGDLSVTVEEAGQGSGSKRQWKCVRAVPNYVFTTPHPFVGLAQNGARRCLEGKTGPGL